MNTVPPQKGKALSRITADDVGFYYSQGCRVMPMLRELYFQKLSELETQGKICLTPKAILERYTINLKKRIGDKSKKYATK